MGAFRERRILAGVTVVESTENGRIWQIISPDPDEMRYFPKRGRKGGKWSENWDVWRGVSKSAIKFSKNPIFEKSQFYEPRILMWVRGCRNLEYGQMKQLRY